MDKLSDAIVIELLALSVQESFYLIDDFVDVLETLSTLRSLHARQEEEVTRCEVG